MLGEANGARLAGEGDSNPQSRDPIGDVGSGAQETDHVAYTPPAERIKKIEERRKRLTAPLHEGEEDVYKKIEEITERLYRLRQQARSEFDGLMANENMPQYAERTEIVEKEDGKKEEVVVKSEVSPDDVARWLEDGRLEHFLSSQFEDIEAEERQDHVGDLMLKAKKVVGLFVEVEAFKEEIEKMREGESPEELDMFYRFRLQELIESRMMRSALQQDIERRGKRITYCSTNGFTNQLQEHEREMDALRVALREEVFSSPEAYYDHFGQELLYARKVLSGESETDIIYETEYVKTQIGAILHYLRRGRPVFIHGELGSGKTQIARHIAKKYLGAEAFLISGRRGLEIEEATETRTIKYETLPPAEEQMRIINQAIKLYEQTKGFNEAVTDEMGNFNLTEEEAREKVLERYRDWRREAFTEHPQIDYELRPFYQAAKEGRMVIIDEMNAIPQHTLIGFNALLERIPCDQETYEKYKRGEIEIESISANHKILSLSGEEIVIKPGFCVVGTGNWKPEDGALYPGRQPLDAALLSRFARIDYDYLPNMVEGEFSEVDTEEGRREGRQMRERSELYRLLCARIINPDLSADIPRDAFKQIERLARVARITQEIFSGYDPSSGFEAESIGGEGGKIKPKEALQENVLDMRKLLRDIIHPWIEGGFKFPLELYIFNNYIGASRERPTEFMFLYKTLFQYNGFFQAEDGWPGEISIPSPEEGEEAPGREAIQASIQGKTQEIMDFVDTTRAILYGSESIRAGETNIGMLRESFRAQAVRKHFSPTEVINAVFGWPDARVRFPVFGAEMQGEEEGDTGVEKTDFEKADRIAEVRIGIEEVESLLKDTESKTRQLLDLKKELEHPTSGMEALIADIAKIRSLIEEVKGLCDASDSSLIKIDDKVAQINDLFATLNAPISA